MISRSVAGAVLGAAMLGGCQLTNEDAVPAVLMDDSAETMETLKATLADATGTASVELGAGDPTQTSAVTVLPPRLSPLETASTAMPTRFNLMMRGETCMVVHSETGEEFQIELPCRPAEG
ncbi:MAG: hypothetical protein AAGI03_07000 [Pseudomonadota bacterium]